MLLHENVVRIPARTAQPIISSVPKCRNPKASRSHQLDIGIAGSPMGAAASAHTERPVRARPTSKQATGASRCLNEDQVVLLVNNDHIKGGGVQVIGRRLPLKSMTTQQHSQEQAGYLGHPSSAVHLQTIDYSQVSGPVVGRRSHRMIQQQHKPKRVTRVYQHEQAEEDFDYQLEPGRRGEARVRVEDKYGQQPLSLVETCMGSSEQTRQLQPESESLGAKQRHMARYQADPLVGAAAEYSLAPMQQESDRRKLKQQQLRSSLMQELSSSRQHHHNYSHDSRHLSARSTPSSSSSPSRRTIQAAKTPSYPSSKKASLGLQQEQLGPIECVACCSSRPLSPPAPLCREPCCYEAAYLDELEQRPLRSASCQRSLVELSCCAEPTQTNQSRHQTRQPSKQQLAGQASARYERQPRIQSSRHHHHHHHSCQANGSTLANKPPAAHRSSSCHDRQHQQRPLMASNRNVPPVQPKPLLNYLLPRQTTAANEFLLINGHSDEPLRTKLACSGRSRVASLQAAQAVPMGPAELVGASDEVAAVSQMYESLAAELKAKLGDPKMGPILLPPKDYDTMSRKQGKLSGIELRRSTNPQLVGPAANRLAPSSRGNLTIHETSGHSPLDCPTGLLGQELSTTGGNGSARSSGRSRDEEDGSIQRSRSNSSSGLGSISMCAGSPNSSPSSKCSSREDMRLAEGARRGANFTRISINASPSGADMKLAESYVGRPRLVAAASDRKDCSPDNGGGSDSGHSGSEHLDQIQRANASLVGGERDSGLSTHKLAAGGLKQITQTTASLGARPKCESQRGKGIRHHNPSNVSDGVLWNGRVEIPLKVNSDRNGNTYLATKQIIY